MAQVQKDNMSEMTVHSHKLLGVYVRAQGWITQLTSVGVLCTTLTFDPSMEICHMAPLLSITVSNSFSGDYVVYTRKRNLFYFYFTI